MKEIFHFRTSAAITVSYHLFLRERTAMIQNEGEKKPFTSETEVVLTDDDKFLTTGELLFEMVKIILLAVVIIIPIRVFLFQPFFVQGASMEPNFEDGEYLVISEFGYKDTRVPFLKKDIEVEPWKEIPRQEPIVFHYPKDPEQY